MTTAPFLSPAWIDAVSELRHSLPTPENLPAAVVNFVLTEPPGDVADAGPLDVMLDTTEGIPEIRLGHHEAPDVVVTTDYRTAQALLVDVDPGAAMAAFLRGDIVIQGELIKLMALNAVLAADPNAAEVADRIRALTA